MKHEQFIRIEALLKASVKLQSLIIAQIGTANALTLALSRKDEKLVEQIMKSMEEGAAQFDAVITELTKEGVE